MPNLHNISDEGDLKKYRTEIPNIIDDLGLDPYEGRLYFHYKRVCGAIGGTCTQSTRTIAETTKMSPAKISLARRTLADKGLIEWWKVGQYVHVKIVDVWELNFAYFSVKDRPSIDGWTIQKLSRWIESVYHINTYGKVNLDKCLPDKQTVPDINTLGEKCLPHKTKKEQKNKNNQEERTRPGPIAVAISEVCELELELLDSGLQKEYTSALKFFVDRQTPPNLILEFRGWWDQYDWRGQQGASPSLKQFREKWRSFEKWVETGRPKRIEGTTPKPTPPTKPPVNTEQYERLRAEDEAQIYDPLKEEVHAS